MIHIFSFDTSKRYLLTLIILVQKFDRHLLTVVNSFKDPTPCSRERLNLSNFLCWQLLNFYNHVFKHPDFDPRKMLQAKRSEDKEALEVYLDRLVPNFRKNIGNIYLADAMFPRLKNRIEFRSGRMACYCVLHDTVAPEGLDWRVRWDIPEFYATHRNSATSE